MVKLTPILLAGTSLITLATASPKGINCQGSFGCMKWCKPHTLDVLIDQLEQSISKGYGSTYYTAGQQIACSGAGVGACCAHFQNGATGDQHRALSNIKELKKHGCKVCGSSPVNPGNKIVDGMLTVNFIMNHHWACGGKGIRKSGVCYFNEEDREMKTVTRTKPAVTVTRGGGGRDGVSTFTRTHDRDMTVTVEVEGETVYATPSVRTVSASMLSRVGTVEVQEVDYVSGTTAVTATTAAVATSVVWVDAEDTVAATEVPVSVVYVDAPTSSS